jgi:uncharacterized protein (DUF362 family)
MLKPRERTQNVYLKDNKSLVAKVPHYNGDYLPESVAMAADLLGGLDKTIASGDKVIIKPNFNCRFGMPLSTNLTFLTAVIELLQDHGAKVTVAESSGKADGPTENVIRDLNVLPILKRYQVPFVNFEKDEWLEMEVPGEYWKKIRVPRTIYEADKRVYLANMRCHSSARFSASLKLSVGWIDAEDRTYLHEDKLLTELKVAELNLGWQPNLVFIDGRRSTNTKYGRGKYIYPNLILASGDMVSIDTQAVKILQSFPEDNLLNVPLEKIGQLSMAVKHGLGTMTYTLLEAQGHLETEQKSQF